MDITAEGLIRISIAELLQVPFTHLMSGYDDDLPAVPCGSSTHISGYTEWVSAQQPAITIGWDWTINTINPPPFWQRVGLPRTNVLLVDEHGQDKPWEISLEHLATVADALPWHEFVEEQFGSLQ